MKLQLVTLAYNHGFQHKMHCIFEILRLEFTIPFLFWNFFGHVLVWIITQQTTHSMT
jgi:hypothetical protein